ncbi:MULTISPECIES: alpha-hydroxy acid oxidase [Novosphingobium]|uniref:alpha-hydroxy acid oxidase n=1 Tax=Novosphingobium TaxID=165696 RepID=UPI0022F28250|nr:alpha-hydroxy acid oxidase [Novosphingobium resinovorum]GLK42806.1 putative mycofactocin system heme/flavin oxidoreductase MftD [Novosphingobium resinovorum]
MFRSVAEAREIARRRLPPAVFHYIDGGKEDEATVRANEAAFARWNFLPAACPTATRPDLETTILGRRCAMPLAIAPTGFVRIVHADGELGAARAAARHGLPIAISTWASAPAGDVVAANPDCWFQLYMIGGRDGAGYCIDLAREAGCRVLVVTADIAGVSPADRIAPPLPDPGDPASILRFAPSALGRPRWLWSLLRGGLAMPAPNAPRRDDGTMLRVADAGRLLTRTPLGWDDLRWVRKRWSGPLVLKGVMRPGDALKALECGVDGIVVSNHGGKVLDGSAATLDALPAIAEAVGGRCEILLDGGLRRGADLVRARAFGANAALIGRPWLWGLAAGGEHGVAQILDLFRRSLSATLANLDLSRFDEVDGSVLRLNGGAAMHEAG